MQLREDVIQAYDEREEEFGSELMRWLERALILQLIDQRWREHLYDMDYLREGIHLRGFAQIEPIVAYKNEAFTLFQDLMHGIWSDFARLVYHVEVEVEAENGHGEPVPAGSGRPPGSSTNTASFSYSGGTSEDQPSAYGGDAEGYGVDAGAEPAQVVQQRRVDEHEQIGRNDPCWCGSGKKFKKCHGA